MSAESRTAPPSLAEYIDECATLAELTANAHPGVKELRHHARMLRRAANAIALAQPVIEPPPAPQAALSAPVQVGALLRIVDELDGEFDRQLRSQLAKLDYDPLDEDEFSVIVTAKQLRALADALAPIAQHAAAPQAAALHHDDTTRLDFVLQNQAFIVEYENGLQLQNQDEDENFHVLSGVEYFQSERAAIDAAIERAAAPPSDVAGKSDE